MGAKASGQPASSLVDLDVGAGDFLRYAVTLEEGAVANYAIANQYDEEIMASSGASAMDWKPKPGERSNQGKLVHSLAMVFVGADKYRWKVEHMKADGTVKEVVRDLTFVQSGGTQIGTSSFTIFL